MIRKSLVLTAVALAAVLLFSVDQADARRGGGGGGGGFRGGGGGGFRAGPVMRAPAFRAGPRVVGPRFVGPRVVVRRPYRRFYGGPVFIAGSSCAWLRQRAIVTGSPYWWRRYNLCRGF